MSLLSHEDAGASRKRSRVDGEDQHTTSATIMSLDGADDQHDKHEEGTTIVSPAPTTHVYLDGPVLGQFSDLMLLLDDHAFHVCKARVAATCRWIYALLEENPAQRVVPIDSVSGNWSNCAADLHLFLQAVYDPLMKIPRDKILILFKMAHWLDCRNVRDVVCLTSLYHLVCLT